MVGQGSGQRTGTWSPAVQSILSVRPPSAGPQHLAVSCLQTPCEGRFPVVCVLQRKKLRPRGGPCGTRSSGPVRVLAGKTRMTSRQGRSSHPSLCLGKGRGPGITAHSVVAGGGRPPGITCHATRQDHPSLGVYTPVRGSDCPGVSCSLDSRGSQQGRPCGEGGCDLWDFLPPHHSSCRSLSLSRCGAGGLTVTPSDRRASKPSPRSEKLSTVLPSLSPTSYPLHTLV